MHRTFAKLMLVGAFALALAVSGTAAFAAPDFDVFRYWSSSNAPWINYAGSAPQAPEAYVKMDLDELFAIAPNNHWDRGGWSINGAGTSSRYGDFAGGSQALGASPISQMTVRLKYYEVNGGAPPADAWSLKARLSNGSWVGLGWLDRGTWSGGHYQDFTIPTNVIADLNSGSSKIVDLGIWYSGQDCHVKLAGIRAYGTVVPEPTTIALMGMGVFGLIGGAMRKRRSRAN